MPEKPQPACATFVGDTIAPARPTASFSEIDR